MPSRKHLLIVLVAALALAAGCLGDDQETQTADADVDEATFSEDWWRGSVPSSKDDPDHDHANHSHHANLSTPNFQEIGWNPLVTDEDNQTASGMMCGGAHTREDDRRIAIVHSIDTEVAFVVADVTDPDNPVHLGEVYLPNAVTWDADISADGMHVVVSAYPVGVFGGSPSAPPPPTAVEQTLSTEEGQASIRSASDERAVWQPEIVYRDACSGETREIATEHYAPYGPGLVLFGIQDPEQPTLEDWRSQPVVGPHSVGSHEVGGDLFATSSVTNLAHEASYYSIYTIEDTPDGATLLPHTKIRAPGVMTPELNGHVDAWIHEHPETGSTLAYLANWDGMYVYDISTPQAPVEIGTWQDGDEGSLHTTYPFPEMRDGRQYLIAGQEVSQQGDRPTGWIYLLDVTDPANPEEIARWTLPVKPEWDAGGLQFSTHYVDVLEDTMFVSVNHAGLWAVNISDMSQPRAEGVWVPHKPSPEPWNGGEHMPHVGDVVVDRQTETLTAWDLGGGIYQLTYDDQMPAPPAPKWTERDVAG